MLIFFLVISIIILAISAIALIKGNIKQIYINNRKSAFYIVIAAICAVITFSSSIETKGDTVEEDVSLKDLASIEIEPVFAYEEEKIAIHGRTNLEDNTIITYEIRHRENPEDIMSGTVEVLNNSFFREYDVSGFTDGDIVAWFGLSLADQPDHFLSEYDISDVDINEYIVEAEETFEKDSVYSLAGTGRLVTDLERMSHGNVLLDIEHKGDGPFKVELMNRSKNPIATFVDTTGPYKGRSLGYIEHGNYYYIEITTDGEYEGYYTQDPIDELLYDEDDVIEGSGYGFFYVELDQYEKEYEITHDGDGDFMMKYMAQWEIYSGTGSFTTTQTGFFGIGVNLIEVTTDGDWTFKFK